MSAEATYPLASPPALHADAADAFVDVPIRKGYIDVFIFFKKDSLHLLRM